jgi:hypothetical protein
VPGSLDKKGGRCHLLHNTRWNLLPSFVFNEPVTVFSDKEDSKYTAGYTAEMPRDRDFKVFFSRRKRIAVLINNSGRQLISVVESQIMYKCFLQYFSHRIGG